MHISRVLRKNMTLWERKLWAVLRNRQLNGLKFRRQFKIGNYIADFVCLESKLVIELDGGHHSDASVKLFDQNRQKYIENSGYKVLRFWNIDVDKNIEGVVGEILKNF